MEQYIVPFVNEQIVSSTVDEHKTSYFNEAGKLVAEANFNDGQFYGAVFYGKSVTDEQITQQQAHDIVKRVQTIFEQPQFKLQSLTCTNDEYVAVLKWHEPLYDIAIPNTGMTITISLTGFVEDVTLQENDVTIQYPEQLITQEQARAILQQQQIVTLGIVEELGWQYAYKQKYDLYGVAPDGTVRFWHDEAIVSEASFQPLPQVQEIADVRSFIQGGRQANVEQMTRDEDLYWRIETDEHLVLEEDVFTRACQIVRHFAGEEYTHYYYENVPSLRADEDRYETFRFVYIYEDIAFDFQAITIFVNRETNQIHSVSYPPIPTATFPTLQKPTLSLEQANHIAQQFIDAELTVERDLHDRKRYSLIYLPTYPTSPTGGNIQYIDGFTGDVHWVDTGW